MYSLQHKQRHNENILAEMKFPQDYFPAFCMKRRGTKKPLKTHAHIHTQTNPISAGVISEAIV